MAESEVQMLIEAVSSLHIKICYKKLDTLSHYQKICTFCSDIHDHGNCCFGLCCIIANNRDGLKLFRAWDSILLPRTFSFSNLFFVYLWFNVDIFVSNR